MGYHAPNAEDVYQYIFRIGRHSSNSLCDGFGWSILFVNDGSEVCKEFLVRYGTELCYRTADRVRFVFFSGLTEEETNELASKANNEWGSQLRVGFLPRIIEAIGRLDYKHRHFEFERDNWDKLRPSALNPLDSRDRINRHLNMECEINSAMPGAEEALLLAQRIGIGRFVPCFLLFSDVGNPSVCLFPIAGKSPEFVYDRLRRWIDKFYEINNVTLLKWTKIEESIKELSKEFKSSVYALSQWYHERNYPWKILQRLAFHQNRLETAAAPSIILLEDIEADQGITWTIRENINTFLKQWRSIEKRIADANNAMKWIGRLRMMNDIKVIHSELLQFKNIRGFEIPESIQKIITSACKFFNVPPILPSPNSNVIKWWRSEHGRPLSRNNYEKHRPQWVTYSKKKYSSNAIGRTGEIRSSEFAVVNDVAMAQFVDCDANSAADKTLLALAQYLGVLPEDSSWQQSVSSYREVLVDYFTRLKNYAPAMIVHFGSVLNPPLRWGECIPSVDQRQGQQLNQCLQLLPRLNAIVEIALNEWDAITGSEERRRLEQQKTALTEIYLGIKAWLSEGDLLESDKASIWLAVVSSLSGTRKNLEDKIFSQVKETRTVLFPGRVFSRADATHLLQLLDDYDHAVNSLTMPFENDRDVLRLSLDIPLLHTTNFGKNELLVSPGNKVKNDLLIAVKDAEEAVGKWNSVKNDVRDNSPAGRLYIALQEILSTNGLKELHRKLGSKKPEEVIIALSSKVQIVQVIEDLNLQELLALENKVCIGNDFAKPIKSDTKDEILQSILVAVGLSSSKFPNEDMQCKADSLEDKSRRGQFDIFLAHNSKDKSQVLCLGKILRSRGIYPWIDVEQIPPGRWFQDVLQSGIRSVKSAAIIIGTSGVGKWQAIEINVFFSRCVEKAIPIIPVLLPGTNSIPEGLIFLRELQQVRFEKEISEDAGISSLIWAITGKKPEIF